MRTDVSTITEIWETLDGYAEALGRRDIDKVMTYFAPDPDAVHIGTGADEWCNGVAELRGQFERCLAQSEGFDITFRNLQVSGEGNICWIAADAVVRAQIEGRTRMFDGRCTAVLEKRGEDWLFVQSHFSMPAANQLAGMSFPEEPPEEPMSEYADAA